MSIQFNNFLDSSNRKDKSSVVLFTAPNCHLCDSVKVKLEYIQFLYSQYLNFITLNITENRDLFKEFNLKGVPSLLLFDKDKEFIGHIDTNLSKQKLISFLCDKLSIQEKGLSLRTHNYDVVIIGAGPAGLSAAIYTAEAGLKTALVEKDSPGGQVSWTHIVTNYPGIAKPILGEMLTYNIISQVKNTGADFYSSCEISKFDVVNKTIELDSTESISCKAIIIATGAYPKLLNVPGENMYLGRGISFCAVCDATLYAGKSVIVVGGGKSAAEETLYLSKIAKKVTMVSDIDQIVATSTTKRKLLDKENVKVIFNSKIVNFFGTKDEFQGATIENCETSTRKKVKANGAFLFTKKVPATNFISNNIKLTDSQHIETDNLLHTNIPGVFAAGDCRDKKYSQITIATSEGTIAALETIEYLM